MSIRQTYSTGRWAIINAARVAPRTSLPDHPQLQRQPLQAPARCYGNETAGTRKEDAVAADGACANEFGGSRLETTMDAGR